MTAILRERGNLVRPKRNADVSETSLGSTETELGLPMPLTQSQTKIELKRT
jgi:hypothetical protein